MEFRARTPSTGCVEGGMGHGEEAAMRRVSVPDSEVRPDPGIAYSGVRALTQGQGVLSATLSLHRVLAP